MIKHSWIQAEKLLVEEEHQNKPGGGIGAGGELAEHFTVSQVAKSDAQLIQMENAVDIKVRTCESEMMLTETVTLTTL